VTKEEEDKLKEEEKKARMAESFSDIQNTIRDAFSTLYKSSSTSGNEVAVDSSPWIRDFYASYIIYEDKGTYYKLSYSLLDGEVKFGTEPKEVKQEWVEERSKQAQSEDGIEENFKAGIEILQMAESDPKGSSWEVTICVPGFTKNGWNIPDETLKADVGLFENVDVNLFDFKKGATHLPDQLFNLKSLLVKKKVGWIDGVKHIAGMGIKGTLHFLDSAKWLGKNLLKAKKAGQSGYGLSFDYAVRSRQEVMEGKTVRKLLKFIKNDDNSVDIVTRPAAGGRFERAVAAMPPEKEDFFMNKETLWKLIQEKRPDLLDGKTLEGITDDEVASLARMAMEPVPQKEVITKKVEEQVKTPIDGEGKGNGPDLLNEIKLMQCKMDLKDRLADSDLPDIFKKRIEKNFSGRIFTAEELDGRIGEDKDMVAKMAEQGKEKTPAGDGHIPAPVRSNIYVGLDTETKASMALDRMFGLSQEDVKESAKHTTLNNQPFFTDGRCVQDCEHFDEVPAFRGVREAYEFFTGDIDGNGMFNRDNLPGSLRAQMNITSTTFTYLLGNTLGRRLVKQYRETNYGEDMIISYQKSVKDFRQQEAVLIGGFPDLATVNPEVADYQEINSITDEEATYSLLQKGNILTISRKYIINDDIGTIQRKIDALGRAARRTHAKYVWNIPINNTALCTDGTAMFTNGHGNLGATALSFATAIVSYLFLAKTTEKDSSERLCLLNDPNVKPTIVYPVDVFATAESVINDDFYYSSNDLTTKTRNPLKGKVKGFQNGLMSDTNDWMMFMPKEVGDIIEMGYLGGRKEPLMFVADGEQSERMFLADDRRYKILFEFAGTPVDYRQGYKAVVT